MVKNTVTEISEDKNLGKYEDATSILKELEESFMDIPFENSDYQNRAFVMASNITPARAYRSIGLRMFAKIRAIKELKYGRELEDIDIEEWKQDTGNEFENRRNAIKITKLLDQRNWTDKLLNDAIKELNCLYGEFKKFPKISRDDFEAQEVAYFVSKFDKDLKYNGNAAISDLDTIIKLDSFNTKFNLDNFNKDFSKMLEVNQDVMNK